MRWRSFGKSFDALSRSARAALMAAMRKGSRLSFAHGRLDQQLPAHLQRGSLLYVNRRRLLHLLRTCGSESGTGADTPGDLFSHERGVCRLSGMLMVGQTHRPGFLTALSRVPGESR